ncbi:DUF5615 family PIN-like protein [Ekhidna sp.]|uniref:DUF5615 family PIN-like protein n=1 Tax=Ekhidna sp. TaxID=2608089 RepID=UPI003CCBAE51
MKFLIDNALSPRIAEYLSKIGHDALHVRDIKMAKASDEEIFKRAFNEDRIIISADTDFGFLLAHWDQQKPSVILFRKGIEVEPSRQIDLLLSNLENISNLLVEGHMIIFEPEKIRTRKLPFFE